MIDKGQRSDPYFEMLKTIVDNTLLPAKFTNPFNTKPHEICLFAVKKLQQHLITQTEWKHNFGLSKSQEGPVIGKMFGVLLVENFDKQIGYLAAFSGKLAGGNIHSKFVPPVFDALTEGSFLNLGMQELTKINDQIEGLNENDSVKIDELKGLRKSHSISLQEKLFEQYHFLNRKGETKSLLDIFDNKPPSGAGECAAPKLLQYAFKNQLKPIAITEFWWGLSPKSNQWRHGHFYPACEEKCRPILGHMLEGLELA